MKKLKQKSVLLNIPREIFLCITYLLDFASCQQLRLTCRRARAWINRSVVECLWFEIPLQIVADPRGQLLVKSRLNNFKWKYTDSSGWIKHCNGHPKLSIKDDIISAFAVNFDYKGHMLAIINMIFWGTKSYFTIDLLVYPCDEYCSNVAFIVGMNINSTILVSDIFDHRKINPGCIINKEKTCIRIQLPSDDYIIEFGFSLPIILESTHVPIA